MFRFFFFQAEDGIRDLYVTGVQTCALPISCARARRPSSSARPRARSTWRSKARARPRSEERRVGKECRSRWSPCHSKKNDYSYQESAWPHMPPAHEAMTDSQFYRVPNRGCDLWAFMGNSVKLFFFQAEDGIRGLYVTGVQTCALPISASGWDSRSPRRSRVPARRRYC